MTELELMANEEARHGNREALERLEAELRGAYLSEMVALGQAQEAYEAQKKAEAKLAKAVEALDGVMVGGNHLATILPDSFPPAETEPLIALETIGYGYDFEVWCCWRSIMLARTTLEELTGGQKDG